MTAESACDFDSSPSIRPDARARLDESGAENGNGYAAENGATEAAPRVHLPNRWLENRAEDHLHHFGIVKTDANTVAKFKNVKYVCVGGSALRIQRFAELFAKNGSIPFSGNLSTADRFVMYLTGSVLWVNHGMGVPSLSIMLVECVKLLHYAKASDITFIRIGTSGGVGVAPGTVIVSNGAINGLFQPKHIQYIAGRMVEYDAVLDQELSGRLLLAARRLEIPAEQGVTFCADDFYEGQMRLDGLFCEFREEDKMAFLRQLYALGVRNIEMESTGFAAFTHRAKIPAAVVCVVVVNRMLGDQVLLDKSVYQDFEMRPFRVVSSFINGE